MKKLTNLLVASAVALSAATASADVRNMTGPYAGVNFGYGMGSGNGKMNTANKIGGASTANFNNDLGLKGFRGGLHLGYGKLFQNKFYLGLEGSADLSNTSGKLDTAGPDIGEGQTKFNLDAKRREAFGLALRAGTMFGSMLAYAKIGVETAKWKFKASQSNYLAGVGGAIAGTTDKSKNERLTGLVLGLGMETMLTDHVIFGGEWTHTRYRNSSTLEVTQNATRETLQFKLKPTTNDFRLRLGYKW